VIQRGESTVFTIGKEEQWSRIGLRVILVSVAVVVMLSILDGVMSGPLGISRRDLSSAAMWLTWVTDFRYMFENLMYVGAIVFVGGKFIETRNVFTIGFDRLDTDKVRMKGPDADHVVWIGHRYPNAMEATTVAEAIQSRLAESVE
jgi:hypothetical protein